MSIVKKSASTASAAAIKHGKTPAGYNRRVAYKSSYVAKDTAGSMMQMVKSGGTVKASITGRIRPIGNSKGIILNNQLMEAAGFLPEYDVLIQAKDGAIVIMQLKTSGINTDLSTWDKQFKRAIKNGAVPDEDLFAGIGNNFDESEW